MKLIVAASKWHRMWSMRFIILTAFFSSVIAAYSLLPPDWLPEIPSWLKKYLALADVFTAGLAGVSRLIKQEKLDE